MRREKEGWTRKGRKQDGMATHEAVRERVGDGVKIHFTFYLKGSQKEGLPFAASPQMAATSRTGPF